jgi:hypothetical protein
MNPEQVPAQMSINLVNAAGLGIHAKAQATVPPGGQVALLGSELFPNASVSGWVYALPDPPTVSEMQGFWLSYNAELTALDGSDAMTVETIGRDQIIPLVAGETELNIVNSNIAFVNVTIQLFGTNGMLAETTRSFLPASAFQTLLGDLFPSVNMSEARYVRIGTPGPPIASAAVIRGYLVPTETMVVSGVNVSSSTNLTFPHVINGTIGGASYTTVLGITNPSTTSQTVTITFNSDTGSPITATRTLEAGASIRETAQSLFALPAAFQSGWVTITGTAGIAGFACYADTVAGGLSGVPAGSPQKRLFFIHIANGAPQWQTGLALLNATNARASVDVYAVTPSGTLIGGPPNVSTARLTLDPGKRAAKVLHELIPQTKGVNGGFVFISSDVDVHGIQLFYTENLKVLSNVAPGRHLGATYTPPLQ